MVIRRSTTTARKATRTPAKTTKATKAKAVKATPTPTPTAEKQTRKRVDYGVKERRPVKATVNFPARTRTSTKQSPYADDIASIIGNDNFVVYDGVTSQEEFISFSNTLRNLAKRLYDNRRLQVVWIENATPTHPAGVYVKDGGTIQAREKKVKA